MSTSTLPRSGSRARAAVAERVLAAVDDTTARFAVARWVADRAGRHAVAAHVVTVVPPHHDLDRARVAARRGHRLVWETREYLGELQPRATLTAEVLEGEPEQALLALTKDADLLVLGTERSPAAGVVPSLPTRIAEGADCPVVVVPHGWSARPGAVVVGVTPDGSDRLARELAVTEARRTARPLLLVHAWHLPWILDPVVAAGLDAASFAALHREWLEGVRARIAAADPELHVAAVFAERPGGAALLEAGHDASLIVVGADRLGMLERLVLDSVGRRVLERPPCPVAVVPSGQHHGAEGRGEGRREPRDGSAPA
jgi:nucleotide-binding universal stress UspA family protein